MRGMIIAAATLLAVAPAAAQQAAPGGGCAGGEAAHRHSPHHSGHGQDSGAAKDSAFAALQRRGRVAMGVDQYTSTHCFDALADGGRIELQRDTDDPAGVAAIREHLRGIADAFSRGDFGTPAFVHMREVPGAAVMAARRGAITYTYRDLPRGGEIRIRTADLGAIRAIHDFMAFQRGDHRASGVHP